MQEGPDGLQPAKGFMNSAMAPERSFNDPSGPEGKFSVHSSISYSGTILLWDSGSPCAEMRVKP